MRSEFHKNASRASGLESHCKTCKSASREANKEKLRARAETARAANKGKPKTCNKCEKAQPRSEFHKNTSNPDGLGYDCKSCCRAYESKYREANKEKLRARAEAAIASNKGKQKTCTKCEKSQPRSEFSKNAAAPDGLTARCKTCIRAYMSKWDEANKEKLRARAEAAMAANKGKPKTCNKCEKAQPRSEFSKNTNAPDGLSYNCKTCKDAYYETSKEGRKARAETAMAANKGKPKTCNKCEKAQSRSEFHKDASALDGLSHDCKTCIRAYNEANKEKLRARAEAAIAANKGEQKTCTKCEKSQPRSEFHKNVYSPDGLNHRCADCTKIADPKLRLRKGIISAIRKTLYKQGKRSDVRSFEKLPYDLKQVTEHFEGQFDEHMTWENYGSYWQIDHIYPQSRLLYDSYDHENFQKCWALSNLRPLEASENSRKGNKIIDS